MKVHHIGYLVKSIEESSQCFIDLGYLPETDIMDDETRDIRLLFMVNEGYRVELVEPASKNSRFWTLLKRFKNVPYHICYEAENIRQEIKELEQKGFAVTQPPEVAPCIEGRKVTFMQNPFIGIIELLEK